MGIGGTDVVVEFEKVSYPSTLTAILKVIREEWPEAVVEPGHWREAFVYRDAAAKVAWDLDGGTDENQATMLIIIMSDTEVLIVYGNSKNEPLVAKILGLLQSLGGKVKSSKGET